MRIDANQGLTINNTIALIAECSKNFVELLEQPLPIDSWKQMQLLYKKSDIELMLDESILGLDSIKLAISPFKSCDWIKLKLMKQGSIDRTHKMLDFAKKQNLKVRLA